MDAIKLTNVSKSYPGIVAVDDISFRVEQGSIHGFLGPNGAGKTTTINMISGLTLPTSGLIEKSDKIGLLPEHPPLYETMVVKDFLYFVAKINGIAANCLAENYQYVVSKCGLSQIEKRMIGNLSKGNKQRVGIASALIAKPKIIILDEPTVGLDPNSIVEIRDLIKSLQAEHTVLLSTHQLSEANALCTHITVLNHGKIVETGTVSEIKKRISPHQVIEIETTNVSDNLVELLKNNLPIIEITSNSSSVSMQIKGDDDYRSIVSKLLVDNGYALLGLKQKQMDLEELFKVIVKD